MPTDSAALVSASPPGLRRRYFLLSLLLVSVLAACLIADNTDYLFHAELYESGDSGANSLAVLRAKHFGEIYGAYSRWGFHHPGPALFYALAWGEYLFHDLLHIVPTNYNAQMLVSLFLEISLLCGALTAAARWVRSRLFLPLALLLAVEHWSAVNPSATFMSAWPPFTMSMIFFALVIASASVGAGQGDDLPLLVLAGSFAVHSHVAQPLFVLPLFLIAYGGLVVACRRTAKMTRDLQPDTSAAPWRRFPRAHLLAGVLVFFFLVPLGTDLVTHEDNNFVRILDHLRHHQADHKPYLDSLFYFLRFGAYKPSVSMVAVYSLGASWSVIGQFLASHPKVDALWGSALLATLVAVGMHFWKKSPPEQPATDASVERTRRGRFLCWLFACWLVGVGLTLFWGHIQDGDMYYYNAWFNYTIWYLLAVLGAVAASCFFERWVLRASHPRLLAFAAALICCGGTAAAYLSHLDRYRNFVYNDDVSRNIAKAVYGALAVRPDAPRVKVLKFSGAGWVAATGVTVLLDRLGYPVQMGAEWRTVFGDDHAPDDILRWHPWKNDGTQPFEIWYLVSKEDDPAAYAACPLPDGYALVNVEPAIDPAKEAKITFTGEHPNFYSYVGSGWSPPEKNAPFIWSCGPTGLIGFPVKPVPADATIRIAFDCFPYPAAGRVDTQHFTFNLNGTDFGTLQVDSIHPDVVPHVDVPAAVWNKFPTALISIVFRDAISPKAVGESPDERPMAIGTKNISFRIIQPHENPDDMASERHWPSLDATAGAEIRFAGERANAAEFVSAGWSMGPDAVPFVWSTGRYGHLYFRPPPIPEDAAVEVTFDCFAFPAKGMRPQQRARVKVNGTDVGTIAVAADDPEAMPRVKIPATVLNKYETAALTLEFIDAISPKDCGDSSDPRALALGMRVIKFRTVPANESVQP